MAIDEVVESSSNFPYKVVDRCVVVVDLEKGNKDMVLGILVANVEFPFHLLV
ncbi:hypothetical protein HYC85_025732 [Camellia sinensis]|uniref:Uncharacterized protein n=1 Tax=Camellia sinensis TaxID=4442 RepID=A0A7J7GFV4_CAMSI|nr:hypothetical protein HYC85_025732 [Camellia sinensis]